MVNQSIFFCSVFIYRRWSITLSGAYLKGHLYWQDYVRKNTLVWFDVSDESFGTVDLPRRDHQWTWAMLLLVWKGSLVFFNFSGIFEMWVMDGEAGGWSKYFRIGPLPSVQVLITFLEGRRAVDGGKRRECRLLQFHYQTAHQLPDSDSCLGMYCLWQFVFRDTGLCQAASYEDMKTRRQ